MNTPLCVLGVLGVCRVHFGNPTQAQALCGAGSGGLCWVCWVYAGACACTGKQFTAGIGNAFFLYARAKTFNTPNTPNTDSLKALILLGFKCVGCVLGWAFLCWVGSGEGEHGHD